MKHPHPVSLPQKGGSPPARPLLEENLQFLWLRQTKASRKAYPSGFRHLVYSDGTTGLHILTGIPAGTRVAVKARVVRPDGGRSGYAQAEIVIS